jgi:hypothetical protein
MRIKDKKFGGKIVKDTARGMCFLLLFLFIPASFVRADIVTGLAGWWRFDDVVGTAAADSSGKGNTGTLKNMALPATPTSGWNSGKYGNALAFDGINDYVDCGNGTSLNIIGAITIGAWIKITSIPNSNIVAKGSSLPSPPYSDQQYTLAFYSGNNRIYFDLFPDTSIRQSVVSNKNSWNMGEWYFITATWNGATNVGGMKLYVNGIFDNQGTAARNYLQSVVTTVKIGGTRYFNGLIDDVRIYSRALSASEVLELYNNDVSTNVIRGSAVITNAVIQ